MTSFRILGPVEASAGGQPLPLGGRRQLTLLALLLLNPNRAISNDELIDAVWGSERSGADNRLQMAVARLRKALEPLCADGSSPLQTVSGGYLLKVGPGELDSELFEARLEEGRQAWRAGDPETAAELLGAGLALWRGPPLAEVTFEEFAQAEIRRLEELKLAGLTARVKADLELGRHEQVIGELEALCVQHPVHEDLTALLMLALYRCGRQAEALEVYERTRVGLAEQLGLEPGDGLKSLQAEILQQSPSLKWHAPSKPELERNIPRASVPLPIRLEPYGPSVFVDRTAEREALTRALGEVASSGQRVAFVTGEPGIGKTRLVSEIAIEAHEGGMSVLAGRCDEGLDLPYQPFVEALEHLIEHVPKELLEAHVDRYGDSLVRLVPELASRVSDGSTAMPRATESERYVLYRAIEGLLAAASADSPMLIVLEDLHWADLPTLQLLRRLMSSRRKLSLLLMCTCRVKELPDDHSLRELLADAHRVRDAVRIELSGLGTGDVLELMKGIVEDPLDTADEELVRTVEGSTNGNPFFITELVRSLVETGALANDDGHWELADAAGTESLLPVGISETLASRVRRLGGDVRDALRIAAVLGEEFDLDVVSAAAGVDSAASQLDAAVDVALLVEVAGRPARFRFTHALLQRYLYGELGSGRRTELHTRVALEMEARLEQGRWPIAELARHWVAAGDAHAAKALYYAEMAGDEALVKLAPEEARRWYKVAVDLLVRQREPSQTDLCELLVKRGDAERQAGDRSFRDTLLQAAELAQRLGNERGLIRAALANTRGMQSETGIVDEARIDALEGALKVVGQAATPERAQLLATEAAELMYSPDWERRERLSDEALEIARQVLDPAALSTVLNMRFVSLLAPHTLSERQANTIEGVTAAERLSDPLALFYAYHWRGYALLESGYIGEARSWMAREREIAERFRQPTTLWLARADEANLAIIAGQLEEASQLCGEAFEIGQHSEPDALACYAAQQASIAFEANQLEQLMPMLQHAAQQNPGVPGFRATLALALTETGRRDEAWAILAQAAGSSFKEIPYDVTWLAVACIYAHVSAKLDCLPAAELLYELIRPYQQQIVFPAFGVWGPVGLYLGSLALAIGEPADAERHLARAAAAAAQAGAPIWEARVADQQGRLAELVR